MSDLDGNLEDRFAHDAARIFLCKNGDYIYNDDYQKACVMDDCKCSLNKLALIHVHTS